MKILQYKQDTEYAVKGDKLAVEGKEYRILYKYIDFDKFDKLPANILIAKVEEMPKKIKQKKHEETKEETKEEGRV